MLLKLGNMLKGGGELLAAEGAAIVHRARHLGLAGVLGFAAVAAIGLGLAGLLVAAGAGIAHQIGWIWAVAILSSIVVIFGGVVFLVARSQMKRAVRHGPVSTEILARKQKAHDMIKGNDPDALDEAPHPEVAFGQPPNGARPDGHDASQGDWKEAVAKSIADHPGVAVGAAVCVMALFGPGKSLKLLSRGMMLAGIASNLKDVLGEEQGAAGNSARAASPRSPASTGPRAERSGSMSSARAGTQVESVGA